MATFLLFLVNKMDALRLLETIQAVSTRAPPLTLQPHTSPLDQYDDTEFISRFRMRKSSFEQLLHLLGNDEGAVMGRPRVPIETRLLITLRYLATGSLQNVTADTIGTSQPSVCRIVNEMTKRIAALAPALITFPDQEVASTITQGFYNIVKDRYPSARPFPGVIGAIDGTQIEVTAPGILNREMYRNRKGKIAINVQAICDHRMKFQDVVCRWPGSVHDARIFSMSSIRGRLERKELRGWLLGDSGYGLKPYLMTPISNPANQGERNYSFSHIQTRNCIERAFGLLKMRFRVILGIVRQDLGNSMASIMSCFVLHNFLINEGDEFTGAPDDLSAPYEGLEGVSSGDAGANGASDENDGRKVRKSLIERNFI